MTQITYQTSFIKFFTLDYSHSVSPPLPFLLIIHILICQIGNYIIYHLWKVVLDS